MTCLTPVSDRQEEWESGPQAGALASIPVSAVARQLDATGTARDSRRGAATVATGLHGVSRVLFFWGESPEGCCRCCWRLAPAPVCWRNSKWWCSAAPQPRHGGQPPAHGRGRRGPAQKLPQVSWQRGKKTRTRRRKHRAPRNRTPGPRRQGCQGRRRASTERAAAPLGSRSGVTNGRFRDACLNTNWFAVCRRAGTGNQ